MMKAMLEARLKQYEVSVDAANAMLWALRNAQCEELLATDFDETPKLNEIDHLLHEVKEVEQRLTGARDALNHLYFDSLYQRNKLEYVGAVAKIYWDSAVNLALPIEQSA